MCKELKIAIFIWLIITISCAVYFRNSGEMTLVVKTPTRDYCTKEIHFNKDGITFVSNKNIITIKEPYSIEWNKR